MLYRSELVWLAHQLDQQEHSPDIPSVWKAIRETDLAKSVPRVAEKRQVYLTGEPEIVYSMTDLFDSLPDEKQIHIVTEKQHTHPALNWMSITYYPPHELKQLPDGENVTLFTTAKLPIWSRTYFSKNRISQVVSAEEIMTLHRFSGVRQTNIVEFSYADLLDDTRVILDERSKRPDHQLFPEIPKQFSFKLSQLHEELNWDQELDEVAAHMLNTYWLQNRPPFPEWMPILLREIQQFLRLKQNQHGRTNILEQLEEWGLRDKRID